MEVKEDVDKATSILMENVGFKKQIVKKDEQNVENIVTKNKYADHLNSCNLIHCEKFTGNCNCLDNKDHFIQATYSE